MSLRFCANLNFMFQESSSLLERYSLAKKAGFSAVECATPYDHRLDEILAAKEKAGVEQVLINSANWDGVLGYAAVPGKETEFTKSMDLTVKYAKALNCKRVHVMSGKVPHPSNDNHNIYLKNLKYAATLFEREEKQGYAEWIGLEYKPSKGTEEGLGWLKKLGYNF
ncbi:hypothetical protein AAG570_003453 [Ranatra chinensis]|uniref:Xylose isomerase-like TIM barrel domain-containing protein n=1 Tax=Ranatra chinensis TaxID=642074 RepID=A0ABD0YI61_9HEMI